MHRQYFTKTGAPVWVHVPGTPFTLPGSPRYRERLPGMTKWVDRDLVERVSKGLSQGSDVDSIAAKESISGLPGAVSGPAVGGGVLGLLAGRLAGGSESVAPLKAILEKGIGRGTLAGLKNLPRYMYAAPLLGAALGGGYGLSKWVADKPARSDAAKQTARGLLAEQVLQRNALREAVKTDQPYTAPLLRSIPLTSASATAPSIVSPGNVGV